MGEARYKTEPAWKTQADRYDHHRNRSEQDTEHKISGSNDTRNLPKTVWKLNLALDPKPYAIIKYRPDKKQKFSIETYGMLLLNNKQIELSQKGNIKPYQLFPGSIITIPAPGKQIIIKFNTKIC